MARFAFLKRRKLRMALVTLLLAVVVLAIVAYLLWPYLSALGSREETKRLIADAGPWGPVVFMIMQIAQVVFAPIPGHVVGFVGGFLFGTLWGTVYSMIGTTVGFALVFTLARKLGRPFVEYFVHKRHLEKFDYIAATKGVWVLLIAFIVPIVPDAMMGYVAGLTTIKIRTLMFLAIVGRLPGIFLLSLTGSQAANENHVFVAVILTAFVLLLVTAYWKRNQLEHFMKHLAHKE